MYVNPYDGLSDQAVYEGLLNGKAGWPRWPDPKIQAGYTGTNGVDLLRRAFSFIRILEEDGAFSQDWRGLDYGCGWGRFASVMLSKGPASQFDLCDAWQRTLNILDGLGYENKVYKVSEMVQQGELPERYNFILSFSVFTHLSPSAFRHNLAELLKILKKNGRIYITVRHDEFLDQRFSSIAAQARKTLEHEGVWYSASGDNIGAEPIFGDTIVTDRFISSIGKAKYLGQPHALQHVYRVEPL